MYRNPLQAYEAVSKKTSSGREIEAAALTKAAQKLKACQKDPDWSGVQFNEQLYEALRYNQRVWTILQTELSADDNPLPKQVRLNLLKLGSFVDKRTFDIMAFPERGKLTMLIDINMNIAGGLRQQTSRT